MPTTDDRAAFVGEAYGVWLWLVIWPMNAAWLLAEQLDLLDLRDRVYPDLPLGPPGRAPAARAADQPEPTGPHRRTARRAECGVVPVLPMGRSSPPHSGRAGPAQVRAPSGRAGPRTRRWRR